MLQEKSKLNNGFPRAAVVIFGYRRAQELRKLMLLASGLQERNIYLFTDGPKGHIRREVEEVAEVHKLAEEWKAQPGQSSPFPALPLPLRKRPWPDQTPHSE